MTAEMISALRNRHHFPRLLTLETLVLLADEVLNWDLDILKGDIGGTTAPDTLAIHAPGADTAHVPLNEEYTDAVHTGITSAHRSGEVIRPDTVGDPLLLAVNDVMLAVGR